MTKILKKKSVDQSVLDLALERINRAFDLYDTVDVSFSGGKDSTACLNLTLQVARERGRLPLRIFFYDEEAIPYQTEEYVRRVARNRDIALEWYCLPVRHRNACSRQSPWWSPWDPAAEDLWVRPLSAEALTSLEGFPLAGQPRDRLSMPESVGLLHDPKRYGTVGMVMGIRAQESLTRQRAVSHRTHEAENYLVPWTDGTSKGNIWKVYPIYDWQVEDVWTAPAKFGWDYNAVYDVMEQAGIDPKEQRCSPAYGEEPMRGFYLYKTCFPEIWDKMSMRVPGANSAFLYGRSELFGFGDYLHKPEDVSWEQFILSYIDKFHAADAAKIAESIKDCILTHYRNTSDPILSEVDHPITGVSWKRLLNIAMRGDLKGRRASTMNSHSAISQGKDMGRAWEIYKAAQEREGV